MLLGGGGGDLFASLAVSVNGLGLGVTEDGLNAVPLHCRHGLVSANTSTHLAPSHRSPNPVFLVGLFCRYYSIGSVLTVVVCAGKMIPSEFYTFEGQGEPWIALAYAAVFGTFFNYNAYSWAGMTTRALLSSYGSDRYTPFMEARKKLS